MQSVFFIACICVQICGHLSNLRYLRAKKKSILF